MDFVSSELGSVGVELELQIVDPLSLDLRAGIEPILERCRDSPYIRAEAFQESVEIGTRVCRSAAEIEAHLIEVARSLHAEIDSLGMALCGSGTHPFCRRLTTLTPRPRYLEEAARTGFVAHTQQVFATHVHVGVRSGPEAVTVMRDLRSFLPVLIALSANSPFWRQNETDCACYRHRILAASRSYGIPPSFSSWPQFCDFLETTKRAGLFNSIKDIHWDIRPRPSLGTVEVRVMDAQARLRQVAELATLIRALTVYSSRGQHILGFPTPLPWWLEKENHYQASRLGLDATYVDDASGTTVPLRSLASHVVSSMSDIATELGDGAYLECLRADLLQRPGYVTQRESLARRGSFQGVVEGLLTDFVDSLEEQALASSRQKVGEPAASHP